MKQDIQNTDWGQQLNDWEQAPPDAWDTPPDALWPRIEQHLPPRKRRRPFLFWLLGVGVLVLGTWMALSTNIYEVGGGKSEVGGGKWEVGIGKSELGIGEYNPAMAGRDGRSSIYEVGGGKSEVGGGKMELGSGAYHPAMADRDEQPSIYEVGSGKSEVGGGKSELGIGEYNQATARDVRPSIYEVGGGKSEVGREVFHDSSNEGGGEFIGASSLPTPGLLPLPLGGVSSLSARPINWVAPPSDFPLPISDLRLPPSDFPKWSIAAGWIHGAPKATQARLAARQFTDEGQSGVGLLLQRQVTSKWGIQTGVSRQVLDYQVETRFVRFIDFNREVLEGNVRTSTVSLTTALKADDSDVQDVQEVQLERPASGGENIPNRLILLTQDALRIQKTSVPLQVGYQVWSHYPFRVEALAGVQWNSIRAEITRESVSLQSNQFRLRPGMLPRPRPFVRTDSYVQWTAGFSAGVHVHPQWQLFAQGQVFTQPDDVLARLSALTPQVILGVKYSW